MSHYKTSDGVKRVNHPATRRICGTGYVILSREYTRENYLKKCFRERSVTLITNDKEVIRDCVVTKGLFNKIIFPTDFTKKGSCVVWINLPINNAVIVLDVVESNSEYNEVQAENTFKFARTGSGNNKAYVSGDGENGVLNVVVQGDDTQKGEINVRVLNTQQLAVLDMLIQGKLNIAVENTADFKIGNRITITVRDEEKGKNQATISYVLGDGFTFLDEFANNVTTNKNGVQVNVAKGKTVITNQENKPIEPVVLADKAVKLMSDWLTMQQQIFQALQAATQGATVISAPFKPELPLWIEKVKTLQNSLNALKSITLKTS